MLGSGFEVRLESWFTGVWGLGFYEVGMCCVGGF